MHKKELVVVTGANGGIGSELVRALLLAGHRVVTTWRNSNETLRNIFWSTAEELPFTLSGVILDERPTFPTADDMEKDSFSVDLTDEDKVNAFAEEVMSRIGIPWAVINVAGASTNAMSWKMTGQDFKKTVDDNLLSTFLVSKAFIPDMRKVECGRIINVSSIVGQTGIAGACHYAAAKAGITGLTKSLALELAPKKITVNAIALGYFEAGLINHLDETMKAVVIAKTPMKRYGYCLEFNALVKYLLSTESQFMTGQTLSLNGGLT